MAKKSQQWNSYDLLGIRIDAITKKQFLKELKSYIDGDNPSTYIVTPNSEFFVNAQNDKKYQQAINDSWLSIPDGVFVQWVSTFLSLPVTAKFKPFKALQIIWQYVYTGASIVLNPNYVKQHVPERLSGSQIVYDLAKLAAENNYKIAFAGGYLVNEKGAKALPPEIDKKYGHDPKATTGKIATDVLTKKYPNIQIVTDIPINEKRELPKDTIQQIKASNADILIFGYKSGVQEKWLKENISKTGVKIGLGLGGTLDYVSGIKKTPPKWMRILGVEWFLRPLLAEGLSGRTIPRLRRAWQKGFFASSSVALREKFKSIA